MNRPVIVAAAVGLALLAGCGDPVEPSPPPTSEDALTTTSDAATETEAAPTTEAPQTEEPEAQGPPEMPEEATEQTEAGAEAFALHYIDLINYTGMHPETGLLEPLGADGCKSCANHEESVTYGVEEGDYLQSATFLADDADVLVTDNAARVSVPIEQQAQSYLNDGVAIDRKLEAAEATLVFRLAWDDGWQVSEIQVSDS